VLFVAGGIIKLSSGNDTFLTLTQTIPVDFYPSGYFFGSDSNGPIIYKRNPGFTRVDTATGLDGTDYMCGYAFYFDGVGHSLKLFLRMSGQWFLAQSATDSDFSSFQFLGFRTLAENVRFLTPFVCYAS
jgi:hypothetical protein